MHFKLYNGQTECPFGYGSDEEFAKTYLWYAEKFASEGDEAKDKDAVAFFEKYAPKDVENDIDLLIRAHIFGCCEHISSRASYDNNRDSIVAGAISGYRRFIDVYKNI